MRRRERQQRTVYSVEQREELERFFENNQYPSYDEREALAATLNLQEQQVQVWFKNRRAKFRKMSNTTQQQGRAAVPSPQGPRADVPAPAPAPPAAGPGIPEDPVLAAGPGSSGVTSGPGSSGVTSDPGSSGVTWGPGFSGDVTAPGGGAFTGDLGFYNLSPPVAIGGSVAAESSAFSHMQAWWGPPQGAQNPVLAAATASAPAEAPVWPEKPYTQDFGSDIFEGPTLADLFSSQGPLDGSSSLQSGCPESQESGGEDDSSPKRFLDL